MSNGFASEERKRLLLTHQQTFKLWEALKAMIPDIQREHLSKKEVVERLRRDLKLDLTDDHINKAAKVLEFKFNPGYRKGTRVGGSKAVNGSGYYRIAVLEAHLEKVIKAIQSLATNLGEEVDLAKPEVPSKPAKSDEPNN